MLNNVLTCEALRKNRSKNEKNRNPCFINTHKTRITVKTVQIN
ncbi:conserved hypothetical protein [Xenorhabdus nematophila F1]|nr:conserved hypothetical protein [Xenorhabdus nematophila F1]